MTWVRDFTRTCARRFVVLVLEEQEQEHKPHSSASMYEIIPILIRFETRVTAEALTALSNFNCEVMLEAGLRCSFVLTFVLFNHIRILSSCC
jgi:hypothetical protein|mmetsp:Transcript_49622/g.77447  ORF Transcript_49622/g.77447 Transcript_49622/m.77447 type:complete len:92 (+) Transcript_49622:2704-2979(+)